MLLTDPLSAYLVHLAVSRIGYMTPTTGLARLPSSWGRRDSNPDDYHRVRGSLTWVQR